MIWLHFRLKSNEHLVGNKTHSTELVPGLKSSQIFINYCIKLAFQTLTSRDQHLSVSVSHLLSPRGRRCRADNLIDTDRQPVVNDKAQHPRM